MKQSLLALVLCFTMLFTSCSPTWLTTVDTILAVAAPALVNILQIVAIAEGQPVNTGLQAKIKADVDNLEKLAHDFSVASAAASPGACQQLKAGIEVYSQDIQLVLSVAQVNNPNTQAKIAVLSALVVGTVEAIIALIPQCQTVARTARTSVPFNAKKFVSDYNAALVVPTGDVAVDSLTPKLKLKAHSKTYRYTVGLF
jgi:hypothetical protein